MTAETDEIKLASLSLDDFLDTLRLSQRARERVVAIERELAGELEKDNLDADGCAELVLRAADLIANGILLGFDWSGWDDDDESDDPGGFDLDGMEWGEE